MTGSIFNQIMKIFSYKCVCILLLYLVFECRRHGMVVENEEKARGEVRRTGMELKCTRLMPPRWGSKEFTPICFLQTCRPSGPKDIQRYN